MIAAEENGPGLDGCAKEQIQIIAHIQPQGLLFALSEPDLLVRQVSTNIAHLLGRSPESVLDRSFEAVLGAQQFQTFQAQLPSGPEQWTSTVRLPIGGGMGEMECITHRQHGVLIVELQPSLGTHSLGPVDLDAHIQIPLLRLRAASDISNLSRVAAGEIRRLSGFERVMVYRFDKQWNGEVIAEAVGASPHLYLGLRFPADDIPAQVRQLCLLNPIRTIADVDATPAPIVPAMNPLTGKALDLTYSVLRSASPMHLEYLRSMGVQASLTVSIIVQGRLWGMIACHAPRRHRLARSTRSWCEIIGEALATQVALRTDNAALQSRLAVRQLLDEVVAGLDASGALAETAHSDSVGLLRLFDADGLVSCIEGEVSSHGSTVDTELLQPVIGKLRNLTPCGVATCEELGRQDPALAAYASLVSGALYIDLTKIGLTEVSGDYLLFLRRELVETISWAGNPNQAVTADEHGRLHPRKSFAAWAQTVHGISRPWTETELETGLLLRRQLLLRLRNINARKRAQRTLRESEERFREVFEYAPYGMAISGLDGILQLVNKAFCNMLGYTKDQLQAVTFREITFQEDLSPSQDMLQRLLQDPNGTVEMEKRYVHSNGSVVWAHTKISLVTNNGAPLHFVVHVEDITGRRHAAEVLRESEERFRSMADGSRTIMWVTGAAGEVEFVNRAGREFYGVSSEELQTGKRLMLVHPDDAPKVAAAFKRAVREHAPLSVEARVQRADGEWRMVGTRAQPQFSAGGKFIGHVGSSADITERMQAEEMRERLATIVDSSDDAIISKTLDGTITAWNRGAEKVFGYPAAEIMGKQILLLLPPERINEESEILARIRSGEGLTHFETVRVRKDGVKIDVSVTISPIRDGKGVIVGASKIARDITEDKLAEQVLRSSEEKFRQLAENINAVFFIVIPSAGELLYISPAYEKIWGATVESVYQNPLSWMEAIHPDDQLQARVLGARQLRGEPIVSEYRIRTPDGGEKWIRLRCFPIRDEAGVLIRIAGLAEEITEQKRYELELVGARQAADAANRVKGEFLATMSHEIRTPMNGIIGMTELMLGTALTVQQRRYAGIVRESGESLLRIINDILDFSKIEAKKLQLEAVDFELQSLLEDVVGALATQAEDKGIELLCSADPAIPSLLCGDPGRLQQILTNLVGNSIKFTEKGEVAVRVTLQEEGESDCLLRFSVRDTGIGIPDDKIGGLFQSFSQADTSTTRKFGGTGLGLAISRQLAELMGGEIGVTSRAGKGSEFWVTVRLRLGNKPEEARTRILQPAILNGVRALIVDDNATSREILTTLAAGWGMRPSDAEGGPLALQALYRAREEDDPFQIAVIDMQMPGMDGEGLGRAIRADARLADTRMIMLTSLGLQHGAQHYQQLGVFSCTTKPVRRQELLSLLTAAVSAPPGSSFGPAETLHGEPLPVSPKSSKPFAGTNARILLAEDNATNQAVALGMLEALGLSADIVADGAEALAALQSIPYDLVLMDVRMPVMDGIEATRQIRSPRSAVLNHDVSIIAMTANAMPSDRENCVAAGMNDFVSKPVSIGLLQAALEKWLHSGSVESEPPVFDRAGVLARLQGNKNLATIVMQAFLKDAPQQIQALKDLVERGDTVASGRQAHSLKGASATVGGERLRKLATEMEKAADAGDLDSVGNRIADLEAQFLLLRSAIDHECQAEP